MNIKSCLLVALLLSSFAVLSFGQSPKESRDKGETYYYYGKYNEALPLLLRAQADNPKDNKLKYMLGICYLNVNRPQKAQDYMQFAIDDKKPKPEAFFYMAKSLHHQQKFTDAIKYYKYYLGVLEDKDAPISRSAVKREIKRCVLGDKMKFKKKLAFVEQIADISTQNDEFAPIISPKSSNTLYFTSFRKENKGGLRDQEGKTDTLAGRPRSDIYVTSLEKGVWSIAVPLGLRYNSRQNDMLLDFKQNGREILMYRSYNLNKGNLYLSQFSDEEETEAPTKLPRPISSPSWEGNGYFHNDRVLFFVSDREGGYGGKDIYYTRQDIDGNWSKPTNLGPDVNTPYDEDTPFLSKNGRTLYFSSNNMKSIGGYDIFKTNFIDSSFTWASPENLGMPINSPGDDMYFRLDDSGLKGLFSSVRAGGAGGQDIYMAYFNDYQVEQAVRPSSVAFYNLETPEIDIAIIDEPDEPRITIEPEEIKTYQFGPVFYNNEDQTFASSSIIKLNQLASILSKYPQMMLELTAHTDNSGLDFNNLYFSMKRGEAVANYLTDKGVLPARIIVKGCGSNYPQAFNNNQDGTPNAIGRTLNRRVEIRVFNTEQTPVRIETSLPTINPVIKTREMDAYRQNITGLSYKVQVKRTRQRFEDRSLMKHKHTMIETLHSSPDLLYSVGLKQRFAEAERLRLQLLQEGYEEALLIPYIDGIRLTKDDVINYSSTFPDLFYYLDATSKQVNNDKE